MMRLILFSFLFFFFGIATATDTQGNPAQQEAAVSYTIITSERIKAPAAYLEKGIKGVLGEVRARALDYKTSEAEAWIKKLNIEFIPFVIFNKSIQDGDKFFELARKGMLERRQGEYIIPEGMLLPVGVMFFRRKYQSQKLDIFIMSMCPAGKEALRQVDNYLAAHPGAFKVTCRYIVAFNEFSIDSLHGVEELKEDIRQALIQKYYPDKFWAYLRLYLGGKKFEEAAQGAGINPAKIAARKNEGLALLEKDAAFCKEIGIKSSPTLLWENRVLFLSTGSFGKFLSASEPSAASIFITTASPCHEPIGDGSAQLAVSQ